MRMPSSVDSADKRKPALLTGVFQEMMARYFLALLLCVQVCAAAAWPPPGLMLDLDAARGLDLESGNRVAKWTGSEPGQPFVFGKRDDGRSEPGSGRPILRANVPELGGAAALVFLQQELVCMDEDAFDSLTTGQGHTWAAVVAVHDQRVGVVDVNSFFGNLRNGQNYEGLWGCFTDDQRPWYGVRNGLSFGRFDVNNPQLLAPAIAPGGFHLLIGRMAAGTGQVRLDFFVDSATAPATASIEVSTTANPSKLSVGQERDATQHPGHESFDGEIARLLIWQRPLSDDEVNQLVVTLRQLYHLDATLKFQAFPPAQK